MLLTVIPDQREHQSQSDPAKPSAVLCAHASELAIDCMLYFRVFKCVFLVELNICPKLPQQCSIYCFSVVAVIFFFKLELKTPRFVGSYFHNKGKPNFSEIATINQGEYWSREWGLIVEDHGVG